MSRKWTYEIGYGYESILCDGVMVNKEQAVRALNNYESRIAELSQAVGLITTLKPTMVMDTEHPLDMAKEAAEYVTVRIAELEQDLSNKETEYTDLWDDALTLQSRIAELEAEVTKCHELKDSYCDRIEELEANNDRLQDTWFVEETICPDGSLKPKVSALLSRIAELEAAQRWIPVSERLPEVYRDEDGEFIPFLVCENDKDFPYRALYDGLNWGDGMFVADVTHWMPLPEPPEVQE